MAAFLMGRRGLRKKKKRRLTTAGDDAIMTTGRDDAFGEALPSEGWKAAYQLALDGGLCFISCPCRRVRSGSRPAQER